MARHLSAMVVLAIAAFLTLSYMMTSFGEAPHGRDLSMPTSGDDNPAVIKTDLGALSESVLHGESIAPKLENATAKYANPTPLPSASASSATLRDPLRRPQRHEMPPAELGRASWKLFHTMMARFPEKPTEEDSLALKTYIQLFARLYPCGDCASHFRKLLAKYPPQVGSRNSAAAWACSVHNEVNKRLKKPLFNCTEIGDFYDCGCGDEDGKKTESTDKAGELKLEKDSAAEDV
ncbi:hypothetical protein DL766_009832 [Monosporascus sp. MC13-8B]|uniref:Sulfhydryl oxidase n=1 Tax=Monosporascus cannonballus TaxID=155416 RepID=A0ABY0HFC4_9PEZI|nr:hypothetical protein DL763_009483 [Monosporascus cannonballus]RYO92140.1 hypothetical protein DL762_001798 [Monosporascus cannonballus]RYP13555.1 hypothetical protein DL766_009832 [Monosporascus sp. MC13-8B]